MVKKLQKHIASNFSFLADKKLLLAVSGGIDSVVLAHLFNQLKYNISIAHCNFKLRGAESDKDEVFVSNLGKQLNSPMYSKQFQTKKYEKEHKVSTQIAARNLRYSWFQDLINQHHFDYLITAHHADDNLETFIINLSRGTGLSGLTGIPAINNHIIRPLLPFSREEIYIYATKNSIVWREDESNSSNAYVRNKIRHQVIPVLKELNPNLLASFQKTTEHLSGSQHIIKTTIDEFKKKNLVKEDDCYSINIRSIKQLEKPKPYLYELLREFGFSEWNDVHNLLQAQSGKIVYSKTHRLIKDRESILLTSLKKEEKTSEYVIDNQTKKITIPIPLSFEKSEENFKKHPASIALDFDVLSFPLTLRKWVKGDYFYPEGMDGKKKLSKFFKDEKFSLLEKENTWVLCSRNEIIWVVNHRLDKRYLATNTTKRFFHIKLLP